MASTRASISKASKRPKINIIPPKQLFVDLTQDDTKTPSPSPPIIAHPIPWNFLEAHEQVKTMKIQAGIQVSRPRELKRQLQLWKCFGRHYLVVFVLVMSIKFDYKDVKIASTPMDTEKALLKDSDGDDVDVHLYRSMIGSLM
ncbi:hypothetical protein Tco_1350606 [Tanacetum coccineum]